MNPWEESLREALRRKAAPEGFADRVLARIRELPVREKRPCSAPSSPGRPSAGRSPRCAWPLWSAWHIGSSRCASAGKAK